MVDPKKEYPAEPSVQIVESVIEEIKSAVTETVKSWRELQIKTYWEAGRILREASNDHKVGITALVMQCSADTRLLEVQMGQRSLWFGIKLYEAFQEFEGVYQTEHGQNISVTKLKKMLIESPKKKEPSIQDVAGSIFRRLGVEACKELVQELQRLIKQKQ